MNEYDVAPGQLWLWKPRGTVVLLISRQSRSRDSYVTDTDTWRCLANECEPGVRGLRESVWYFTAGNRDDWVRLV